MRKWARRFVFLFAGLAAAGAVLYFFGLRVLFDGAGLPYLAFTKSPDAQAAEIEKHREVQRAQSPPVTAAQPDPAAAAASASTTGDRPAASATLTGLTGSTYWTSFRGPGRDGHYRQQPVRTDWGATLTPLWKQPVGGGYASFVVAQGRAFTMEQRGAREMVAAYDLATGRELWINAWNARFDSGMGGAGPRATPTWHDGRVFALGATGEFRAIDAASGQTLWRTDILVDAAAENTEHGLAGSPLVVDDTVVVQPGGANGQSVVAYDRVSGKRVWSALDDRASYSSPMLVTLAGVRQILTSTESRLVGLAPENGRLLWEHTLSMTAQPLIAGPDRVFISTWEGTMLELTATGDGRLSARELWRTNRMNNKFTSPLLHDGFIYGLDESILACIDASTGALKWKGGRYGYGQVMLASGHLIVLTEEGELALVRADPKAHQEITRFPAIAGRSWSHPAMSDGFLLIRNIEEMAAFNLRK